MTKLLDGAVALVTGGTRGIGRAIVERFAAEGATVVFTGRSEQSVAEASAGLAGQGAVDGYACDVRHYEAVADLFGAVREKFGRLDILVNNAGVGHFAPVHEITPQTWREVIETNLNGPFYCTHEAAPLMKDSGGGFILNIGSLAGKNPFPGGSAYNASKFGLVGFTEAMMMDLRYDNIRVSSIMPGSVQTEFRPGGADQADWKLDPAQIADTALHLVTMPARNLASRVEMRPTLPPRKG